MIEQYIYIEDAYHLPSWIFEILHFDP